MTVHRVLQICTKISKIRVSDPCLLYGMVARSYAVCAADVETSLTRMCTNRGERLQWISVMQCQSLTDRQFGEHSLISAF